MTVVRIDPVAPDPETLRRAATLLRDGHLVAFPTETVYGLGANALDERAVQRIYEAKGRPAINPVIVHVATTHAARELTPGWTDAAEALAQAFWPGPLTLVVRKSPRIPAIVTAGGDTVGLRVPAHPVALALIRSADIPVAAPSANLSNQVSPTTAAHVQRGLGDRVELILDGGPTQVGIESTVVDVTGDVARVLRPGMITREAIAAMIGAAQYAHEHHGAAPLRSPGMLERHYAPQARVRLFSQMDRRRVAEDIVRSVEAGRPVGALVFERMDLAGVVEAMMPRDAAAYAQMLYGILHAMDAAGCDVVWIEEPPATPEWAGILDRLVRASKG